MTEDPRSYVRVANALRERIKNGEFKPGYPISSIRTICLEAGVSRQTAGKSLRLLEREELITRVPGLGYHVR